MPKLPRIPFPGRLTSLLMPTAVWVLVLAATAWLCAGWYWRLKAPATAGALHVVSADTTAAGNEVATRHLFGIVTQATAQAATESAAPPVTVNIVGVMTGSKGGKGFTVIQDSDKSSRAVVEGEEIEPGVVLQRVLATSIEVTRNGQTETIPLAGNQNTQLPVAPTQPQFTGRSGIGMPGGMPGNGGVTPQPPPGVIPQHVSPMGVPQTLGQQNNVVVDGADTKPAESTPSNN